MKRILRFLKSLWNYILYGNRTPLTIYADRLKICSGCDKLNNKNWTCNVCGCYITKKAKMDIEICPEDKW